MDASHLSRLRQEQDIAVQNTEENIAKWEKFKNDYDALQKRLKTLPDKVSHEVMVPFGSLGFMPGRLVHTNEIMVLLGDNWFVERSAKQAAEIVGRRIKSVSDTLDQLYEQKKLLTPRQVFTKELEEIAQGTSDVQDIVEKYDSDTEKEWRVQHRKNVRAHREKLRKDGLPKNAEEQPKQTLSDEALWARLDELEKREAERNELERDDDEEDDDQVKGRQPSPSDASIRHRRVSWADTGESRESDTESDDIESTSASDYDTDTEDEVAHNQLSRITFTHTRKSSSPEETEDLDSRAGCEKQEINSPRDIYKHFVQPSKPKSILKQKKVKHRVEEERKLATKDRKKSSEVMPRDTQQKAFTGTVVEKPGTSKQNTGNVKVAETTTQVTAQPGRPVSRFRAQRQHRGGANR